MTRRFCVLTTGRAGSTSLMRALRAEDDITLPSKILPCVDDELLHPERCGLYMKRLARQLDRAVDTPEDLVDAFYASGEDSTYAGFKSMPERHRDFRAFVARADVQCIVLVRRDFASTVASFVLARITGSWRRKGEAQPVRWTFRPSEAALVRECVRHACVRLRALAEIESAINMAYEDLCDFEYPRPTLRTISRARCAWTIHSLRPSAPTTSPTGTRFETSRSSTPSSAGPTRSAGYRR